MVPIAYLLGTVFAVELEGVAMRREATLGSDLLASRCEFTCMWHKVLLSSGTLPHKFNLLACLLLIALKFQGR